jgi:hypothetical protein
MAYHGDAGMATSIRISEELRKELIRRKFHDKETYEDVIWDMIENSQELNERAKKEIKQARAEIKGGKSHTLAKVKKDLAL